MSNLGGILSGALTGNTPAQLPGSHTKDPEEKLVQLLFKRGSFRADLKEEESQEVI